MNLVPILTHHHDYRNDRRRCLSQCEVTLEGPMIKENNYKEKMIIKKKHTHTDTYKENNNYGKKKKVTKIQTKLETQYDEVILF